jgi:hypothetical protein
MLSEHEFIVAVRDKIFPNAVEIERLCVELFNKKYQPGIGRSGFAGTNEYDWTIQMLKTSINILQKLYNEKGDNIMANTKHCGLCGKMHRVDIKCDMEIGAEAFFDRNIEAMKAALESLKGK